MQSYGAAVGMIIGIWVGVVVLLLWPGHTTVTENGKPCRQVSSSSWVCP